MSIPGVPDEFEELMPCSACPDGYVWDSNGPTCKPCPVCKGHAAAGYRAAQAAMPPRDPTQAMIDAGEKRRREIAGRGLCIGTIWRAMYDAWAQEQTSGAASAVTDGPAADPIADLCAELRATHCSNENLHDNAAYELERPARTERLLQACIRHETARAERAEAERDAAQRESEEQARLLGMSGSREAALLAERDTLRECVRAADAMRHADQVSIDGTSRSGAPWSVYRRLAIAYDAARAKVKK